MRFFLSIILVLSLSVPAYTFDCFKCKSRDIRSFAQNVLVCNGDTIGKVIKKCGMPQEEEKCGSVKVRRPSGNKGSYIIIKVPLVKYRYDCGNGQFIKELMFQGARLKSIKNLPGRGSGTPVCW